MFAEDHCLGPMLQPISGSPTVAGDGDGGNWKPREGLGGRESEARRGKMGSDAKTNGTNGGFKSRVEHALYSGDKKHVMAGIAIITVVFGLPWFLMSRGSKHQSHQDYMEKADKARRERLSPGSASTK